MRLVFVLLLLHITGPQPVFHRTIKVILITNAQIHGTKCSPSPMAPSWFSDCLKYFWGKPYSHRPYTSLGKSIFSEQAWKPTATGALTWNLLLIGRWSWPWQWRALSRADVLLSTQPPLPQFQAESSLIFLDYTVDSFQNSEQSPIMLFPSY